MNPIFPERLLDGCPFIETEIPSQSFIRRSFMFGLLCFYILKSKPLEKNHTMQY